MTKDQERIIELICGRAAQDRHGLPTRIYLKEGSPEYLEARRALARMLRSSTPLDLGLRCILADLIDPDRDEVERTIGFKNRREGKRSNAEAEKMVAEFIAARLQKGDQVKRAMSMAGERFGIKRSRLHEIWHEWSPILERLKHR
ncbi:hypothetical protein QA640_24340 [Bradyrhizobium sp. CB82]|uniref:hypothetical protein n=1 Tax=Bradyrhizobium sp. CB82 TaxID=3039159 RepID=UPI0024B17401|nr:hypothetical protein [Bradyrhizobium sp. CB82]WFU37600.1 hypothetical protein QA640_24340 [Bradyrhizobium sp. CB82]